MNLRLFGSFALPAIAVFALTLNASVEQSFSHLRLGALLVILISIHLLRYPRVLFCRELVLYSILFGYMVVALLWTDDVEGAKNTLVPAIDFILILILFGALVTYHDFRAVLAGTLGGFLMGAVLFTLTQGFPFAYPADFSYNAVSVMYLSGLFITLVFGWYTRLRVLSLAIELILLLHIVATTSIKTNLGIVLGAAAAGVVYWRPLLRVLRHNAIPLVALAGVIAYTVVTNDALVERVQAGVDRVVLGVEVLNTREDMTSSRGFAKRTSWTKIGLEGSLENPLFGHGVEAFRDRYGLTSHSTVTDVLYNFGLIGLVLFYGMFISVAWRLVCARDPGLSGLHAIIFGVLVCYAFITLSGTMYYNSFLALFIALSTALLHRYRRKTSRPGVSPGNGL